MARREFSKSVYAQIAKARHASQWRDCLRSPRPVLGKTHVDHTIAHGSTRAGS